MYLAENLKFLREQRGKTQQELAKLFGVEQKTLSSWECGSRTPAIGMIVEMAKYYEVSLDDLVLTDMKPPIPVYALNIAYLRKKYGMETLGIGKTQYNMLREVGDPSIRDLEILRYKPDLKRDEFQTLRYITDNGRANNYTNYIDMMKYTTLHKVCRYISDKKIKYDHDYFDYIGWIEKMGYDMTNEFNLFPKNFVNVHDEMSKQYVKFKDKQAREDAKRFNQTLKKLRKETKDVEAMNLNIEGLFIRLPNRLEELKKEGEALHHCVGTYMERVRKGETMIFFIRRKEEPEKPYYTLEWHGKVVQCRGSHNCDMTPEVKAFVQIFQEKMTEYASEPPKHRKAG